MPIRRLVLPLDCRRATASTFASALQMCRAYFPLLEELVIAGATDANAFMSDELKVNCVLLFMATRSMEVVKISDDGVHTEIRRAPQASPSALHYSRFSGKGEARVVQSEFFFKARPNPKGPCGLKPVFLCPNCWEPEYAPCPCEPRLFIKGIHLV